MLLAIITSIALIAVGKTYPVFSTYVSGLVSSIDFPSVLMGAMLNFLLFAGAIHISMQDLAKQKLPILILSTLGVIVSTFLVGSLMYALLLQLGLDVPLIQCLVFGALISPTDPLAVIAILKRAKIRKHLEVKIAGESLFNDGVSVLLFAILLQLAQGSEVDITFKNVAGLFVQEMIGGLVIGFLLGYIGSQGIKRINDYQVTVLITVAIVMGGYMITRFLHISGPLTMAAAGLVIGNYGKKTAMSITDKDYLDKFWEMIDEILNAILFMIIGLELLLIPNIQQDWIIGLVSILIVLLSRYVSIWLPMWVIPKIERFDGRTMAVLVWGGLRGGVSIALALSIDTHLNQNLFLSATYYVVVFSIVVQGLSMGKLITFINRKQKV
ncbi:sodium:proton antiporter [Chryseotalea sanaruensis]|uniref:Sodium:proton antiporter n=2 Tax=Chryseotalea sanaruensis TaxID=2482724 RepID=A0A401U9E3_9BACT|nr:sodium:proton antiporter [Chryseotalea sanaruensis]